MYVYIHVCVRACVYITLICVCVSVCLKQYQYGIIFHIVAYELPPKTGASSQSPGVSQFRGSSGASATASLAFSSPCFDGRSYMGWLNVAKRLGGILRKIRDYDSQYVEKQKGSNQTTKQKAMANHPIHFTKKEWYKPSSHPFFHKLID